MWPIPLIEKNLWSFPLITFIDVTNSTDQKRICDLFHTSKITFVTSSMHYQKSVTNSTKTISIWIRLDLKTGTSHNWQWKWSQFFCDHFHSQLWLIPQKFWVWPIPHLITCVTISTVSIMSMSTATIVTFSTEFFVTNYIFPSLKAKNSC